MSSPAPGGSSARGGVNEFALKIGTVNGTGSASANGLLRQVIFRMGIPVSGKNLFPSNIQGLPTWYEIRVNHRGYTARTRTFDMVVAMNPATYAQDVRELNSGGWLVHDSSWPLRSDLQRDDITYLGVPLAEMCVRHFEGDRERILMKNIVYVGVLGALLDMDMGVVRGLLEESFSKKKKLLESNFLAVQLGFDYAKEHFPCPLPIRLERMDENGGNIMIDGNTAAALGCVYAGAVVAAWYPITPSTSLVDAFSHFCERYRKDPETKKNRFLIVQVEDELAAVGVVIGAAWAGARSFTATSGPGISLMGEFIGLAYYAEVPAVIFDIQRAGPSTGMPTRTQQGDILSAAYASHGDTKHILLFPSDPAECFHFAVRAFDVAERFQTPVFVLSDLDIGMNDWVVPEIEWDDAYRPDRGKVLGPDQLEKMERFQRYLDVDGDGIPYRTLPGAHPKGAYFARGSGHDKFGRYTEDEAAYADVLERIARKIEGAAVHLPEPVARAAGGAKDAGPTRFGILSLGGTDRAVLEAQELLGASGIQLDYLRVRSFPFHPAVKTFLGAHERTFVVEQNRDGQLATLLTAELAFPRDRLESIRFFGGMPLSASDVVGRVQEYLNGSRPVEPKLSRSFA